MCSPLSSGVLHSTLGPCCQHFLQCVVMINPRGRVGAYLRHHCEDAGIISGQMAGKDRFMVGNSMAQDAQIIQGPMDVFPQTPNMGKRPL